MKRSLDHADHSGQYFRSKRQRVDGDLKVHRTSSSAFEVNADDGTVYLKVDTSGAAITIGGSISLTQPLTINSTSAGALDVQDSGSSVFKIDNSANTVTIKPTSGTTFESDVFVSGTAANLSVTSDDAAAFLVERKSDGANVLVADPSTGIVTVGGTADEDYQLLIYGQDPILRLRSTRQDGDYWTTQAGCATGAPCLETTFFSNGTGTFRYCNSEYNESTSTGHTEWNDAQNNWDFLVSTQGTTGALSIDASANTITHNVATTMANTLTCSTTTTINGLAYLNSWLHLSTDGNITAAATSAQDAYSLVDMVNVIKTTGATSSVTLVAAEEGRIIYVYNDSSNAVDIYPADADRILIGSLAPNAAHSLATTKYVLLVAVSSQDWAVVSSN